MKGKSLLYVWTTLVLLALLGCSRAANGEDKVVPRPDGRIDGPAQLAGLLGAVELQNAKGKRFAARAGMWLGPEDELRVPAGGLAVVWIKGNNYVVRIDEEVDMRVDDIFLLNAPRNEKSIAEQVDALLSPAERANAERIVGWRAGLRAIDTMGHKREAEEPMEEERAASAEQVARPMTHAAPPAPSRKPPADSVPGTGVAGNEISSIISAGGGAAGAGRAGSAKKEEERRKPRADKRPSRRRSAEKRSAKKPLRLKRDEAAVELDEALDAEEDKAERKSESPSPVWMRVVGSHVMPQESEAPALLKRIAANDALKRKLGDLLDKLGKKHYRKLRIRLRVSKGLVDRIWIQGGLPVPKTLRDMAIGQALPEQDGWFVLELVLR